MSGSCLFFLNKRKSPAQLAAEATALNAFQAAEANFSNYIFLDGGLPEDGVSEILSRMFPQPDDNNTPLTPKQRSQKILQDFLVAARNIARSEPQKTALMTRALTSFLNALQNSSGENIQTLLQTATEISNAGTDKNSQNLDTVGSIMIGAGIAIYCGSFLAAIPIIAFFGLPIAVISVGVIVGVMLAAAGALCKDIADAVDTQRNISATMSGYANSPINP